MNFYYALCILRDATYYNVHVKAGIIYYDVYHVYLTYLHVGIRDITITEKSAKGL